MAFYPDISFLQVLTCHLCSGVVDYEKIVQYLRKFIRQRKEARLAAYFESGRIVAAYALDYSCRRVSLKSTQPESETVIFNYRRDAEFVKKISSYKDLPPSVKNLVVQHHPRSQEIVNNLALITAAGFVVRGYHRAAIRPSMLLSPPFHGFHYNNPCANFLNFEPVQ